MQSSLIQYTVLTAVLIFNNLVSFSQSDTTGKVRYTVEYVFNDGVYITFNQLLANKPLSAARIITTFKEGEDYYVDLMKSNTIQFVDDFGVKQDLDTRTVWGYCNKGIVYVQWNREFYRLPYIGHISHFIAMQTTVVDRYSDPFYNSYYAPMGASNYETKQMVQNIIDFDTGMILSYSVDAVAALLIRDPELSDEFNLLKKRQKKQLLFFYIRKYNERNPLYLPENTD